MKKVLSLVCFIILNTFINPQSDPEVLDSLIIADAIQSRTVHFGIDPYATDGIDLNLGEANLPPFPPPPALEVRFSLPESGFSGVKSSYKDFRSGITPFTGQSEHRLKYQKGLGGSLKINYNLPQAISIHVEDIFGGILLNADISGSGSLDIPDAIDQLKLLINYSNATDVGDEELLPETFNLSQNYPNPFNPSTEIEFSISKFYEVKLKVFNLLGNEVAQLINEQLEAGNYSINFNASELSSGVYFYQLYAGGSIISKKMILQK